MAGKFLALDQIYEIGYLTYCLLAQEGAQAVQQVLGIGDAVGNLMNVIRQQQQAAEEMQRTEDNEFNIRKVFLENTINKIKEATLNQYNVVICTDQAEDDFEELQGQWPGLDLVEVNVGGGKNVNFQVYVFDTGKYLRRGKWEKNFWNYWGQTAEFTDIFMHVHFEKAQPKLDPDQVQQQQAQNQTADAQEASVNQATQAEEDESDQRDGAAGAGPQLQDDQQPQEDQPQDAQQPQDGQQPQDEQEPQEDQQPQEDEPQDEE